MPWYENRNGEKLWYEDHGAGCPVVLVHGWCMSSAVWKYQFEGLSGAVRLVAPDLRGHGRSRGMSGHADFNGFADDLADLFKQLNLSRAVLAGWSMGGQAVLQAFAQLSGQLSGVVLVSATPCFTACDSFAHGLSVNEARGMRLKVERSLQRALEGFHSRLFSNGELDHHPSAQDINGLLSMVDQPEPAAALDALDALVQADMRPLLAGIGVPVLILNGAEDRICLPPASSYLEERISGAEHIVFPGCGHVPFLTQSRLFNSVIGDFIRSISEHNA